MRRHASFAPDCEPVTPDTANRSVALARPAPGRFVALDGLRGIAALLILMGHYQAVLGQTGAFRFSYLSVDFFFLLSGFVLVPLFEGARQRGAAATMAARVLRFWPLMALGVALGAGVHLLRWPVETVAIHAALGLLIVPLGWGGQSWFALNMPQWSLLIELLANALHVLLLRRLQTPALIGISAASWVVLAFTGRILGDDAQLSAVIAVAMLRALCAYPLGVALARERHRLPQLRAVAWWLPFALLVAVMTGPALCGVSSRLAEQLICLAFPAIVLLAAAAVVPAGREAGLARLGRMSFPLYATHFPLLEGAGLFARDLPPVERTIGMLAALIFALLLADRLGRGALARGLAFPQSWTIAGAAAAR